MKADAERATSWFEDEGSLEREIRGAVERRRPAPSVPGYEDLREIGAGGQGVVYVATQRGTHRRVAIKVLREPLASAPEARRRFEREIDLAAALHHPHIVTVYDGGTTHDGRPYLVMELIEGAAIDHCAVAADARAGAFSRRKVEPLLRLFATVCDAVQHAHQRGVIHRDLKPGNIRVDQDGVARILDFGLAKAVGPTHPASVTATEAAAGRFLGSLPWASPEQAAGRADAVDVRSDTYALGVVLYQLVTGSLPYDVGGDLAGALRNVVEAAPVDPRRLVPKMDTDLVTILLRALAKDPERRFQSAGDLAADVRAYLSGGAIAARRDSAWYLVRVATRRHKRVAALVAAFVVALAAATVVSLKQWRSAVAAGETSKEAMDLLLDSLGSVDPDVEGREARVIDALDRAAKEVDARFGDEVLIRANLHERFATLFNRLGRPDRALDEATKAVALRRQIGGPDDPKTLEIESERLFLRHLAGQSKEVVGDLEALHARQKQVAGVDDAATLLTADHLAKVLRATGRLTDAEAIQVDALARARAHFGPDSDEALSLIEGLAHVRRLLGNPKGAEELQREAYERRVRRDGPRRMSTMYALSGLVVLLTDRGALAEAEPLQRELLERSKARLGDHHPATLTAANTYATILQNMGRIDEAATLFQATHEARVKNLGADHGDTLVTLQNLATARTFQKNHDEAIRLTRMAIDLRRAKLGETHLDTLISWNNLGGALREQGRISDARDAYEKAFRGAETSLEADNWMRAVFRANYAATLTTLGAHGEAEPLLLGALATVEGKLGTSHAHTKTLRRYLVTLYDAANRPSDAARYREAAPASRP